VLLLNHHTVFFFFLVGLGFELRASWSQSKALYCLIHTSSPPSHFDYLRIESDWK
jgi:hypothetical protein